MQHENRCFAEIDLDVIDNNLKQLKKYNKKIMAIVKADAYGHGYQHICKSLENVGLDFFGVSNINEAIELRTVGITTPILILGYTDPKNAKLLSDYNITQAIFSKIYAKDLNTVATDNNIIINAHFKIDTGMGRIGFTATKDIYNVIEDLCEISSFSNLNIDGIFTHFAVADTNQEKDVQYTNTQHSLFDTTVKLLQQRNINFKYIHCLNSAGILQYNQWQYDMVRAGIILYGCSPSNEVTCDTKPALQLKASVSLVKNLNKGESVSYGCIFTSDKDMKVATVSAGYADGYPRALSNIGIVSVKGKSVKVIGRVCMDQLIIDVSNIDNVQQGDIVTLYGTSPADTVTEVATKSNTINYEILCRITRRVPRVYTRNGEVVAVTEYLGNI